MMEILERKLKEIGKYVNGKAFKPEDWQDEGIPIIRIENLNNKDARFNYFKGVCEEKYHINKGDILLSWSATLDAFIWHKDEAYLNQHIFKVLPDQSILDYDFSFYLMKYAITTMGMEVHGSTMVHVTKPKFDNFKVRFPKSKNHQAKLANELKRQLEKSEQMRQAALKQKEAVEALQQKQLDEILSFDKFSKLKKLRDFKPEISAGKAVSSVGGFYTSEGIPYLQVNNIDNNRGFIPNKIVYISEASHKALSKSEVLKDDVLINIVGPPIGKICWYPNEQPANINQAVVRVRCPKEINYKFLTYLLRTSHYYNHFVEVKVGARQWNVSSTNIADLLIPEIPIDKQMELVAEIEAKNIDNLKLQILKQLEAIKALPAAILREVFEFNTTTN